MNPKVIGSVITLATVLTLIVLPFASLVDADTGHPNRWPIIAFM